MTNNGPSLARDVVLTDPLPAEVTFAGATFASGSGVCQLLPSNAVECEIDDLAPGAYAIVFIDMTVKTSVPHGTIINNTATATTSALDANGASDSGGDDGERRGQPGHRKEYGP